MGIFHKISDQCLFSSNSYKPQSRSTNKPPLLLHAIKRSELSKARFAHTGKEKQRLESYILNSMTMQNQLLAFTLLSSSCCHVKQVVNAKTGSDFKYFKNLPNHILLSEMMTINVLASCHSQTSLIHTSGLLSLIQCNTDHEGATVYCPFTYHARYVFVFFITKMQK